MPHLHVGELVSGGGVEPTTAGGDVRYQRRGTKASRLDRRVASAHGSKNGRVRVSTILALPGEGYVVPIVTTQDCVETIPTGGSENKTTTDNLTAAIPFLSP